MPKDYSPFTPGQPVPLEFFVGRAQEIEQLCDAVKVAARGRLKVVFVTGERGIGKSSLASFIRSISEREYQALGVHTFLGGVSSLDEMARRVFDRLLKDSIDKAWWKKIKDYFGQYIREVGLFGISVEFGPSEGDLKRMVHDFAPALRNLINKLQDEKKVIFLVLDDINGMADSLEFANWLKSLVDEIATAAHPIPLCMALVGLEERRQSLIALQPSLARVFEVIHIKTWSDIEAADFFKKTFCSVHVEVEDDALATLVKFTGGLPVIAHEIGDAVWKIDTDNRIDAKDALRGVIMAADIIGRKHLEPQVFQAIRSVKYRSILRKIARYPFHETFTLRNIRAQLTEEEKKVFHHFLQRMKKLGVLVSDKDAGSGIYTFSNRLHYLYFWLEAERALKT